MVWLPTVTSKLQVADGPLASVAVQTTVVVPTGKASPDAGTQAGVTAVQVPVRVGAGKATAVLAAPGGAAAN